MAHPVPMPPPGFDDLSADEKVSYVQSLWERVTANQNQVPVPEWHRAELRQRLQEREARPGNNRAWDEVRDDLRRELNLDSDE